MVDEDAGEPVPHRAVDQRGGHRRIDPARQAADHPRGGADLAHDPRGLALDEMACGPVRRAATDLEQEVGDDLAAAGRVGHLGMELYRMNRLGLMLEARHRRIGAGRRGHIARRRRIHVIAVAHPALDVFARRKPLEQPPAQHLHLGAAVFLPVGVHHLRSGQMGDHLHAVAEAQHRDTQIEQALRRERSALVIHRVGAAREDNPLGLPGANPLERAGGRMDFRIHVGLADPARDELGELGPVVENEYPVVVNHVASFASKQSARSPRINSSSVSRRRATAQRPRSTRISGARGLAL